MKRAGDKISSTPSKKLPQKFRQEYSKLFPCLVASKVSELHVRCLVCEADFKCSSGGKNDCQRHVETVNHKERSKLKTSSKTLKSFYVSKVASSTTERATTVAELNMCQFLVEHNLPFAAMDSLSKCIRESFPETASAFTCGRSKATALVREMACQEVLTLAEKMKKSPFSLATDGSNDQPSGAKHYPIVVRVAGDSGVEMGLLSLCSLEGQSTGKNIFDLLDKELETHGIPWTNCLSIGSDNAPNMVGHKAGVISYAQGKHPSLFKAGCVLHLVHIGAKKGADKMGGIEDALIETFSYFKKSSLRKSVLQDFQDLYNLEHKKCLKHVQTRWLSIERCVERLLYNWSALKEYFFQEKDSQKSALGKAKAEALSAFYRSPTNRLRATFLLFFIKLFAPILVRFQSEEPLIHSLWPSMVELLRVLLSKLIKPESLLGADILKIIGRFFRSDLDRTSQIFHRLSQFASHKGTQQRASASASGVDVQEKTVDDEYGRAKPFSQIPGPKGLPIIGQWLDYKRHPWKIHRRHIYIQQLREEYGDIVKESWAGNTVLHLLNPNYIKKVYESDGKHPKVPPLLQGIIVYRKGKQMAAGLGNSNGEEWYRLRTEAQKALVRPQKVLDYLYLENEVVDDFMRLLPSIIEENGEVDDLNRWILRWGVECSFNVFLEKRMGFLTRQGREAGDTLINRSNDVFTLSTKLWFSLPFYKYFPTPAFKQFYQCEDFLSKNNESVLAEAVQEYRNQLEGRSNTDKRYLFLSYMLSNQKVDWNNLVAIALSILTDTLSTTCPALLYNLYTLAANPDAQEKAYQEAVSCLLPSGEMTVQGFNSCTYIKACIKETFRFFPIGLDVQRLAGRDMVIGGYQVPEGTYICLENYVPLHDPAFIPNPDQFSPERWLRDNVDGKEKDHPYILIPFSIGIRMCLGRRFAEQEMVMMIARILRDYRLEWHHEPLDQTYQLLQVPDREVKVKFVPRS